MTFGERLRIARKAKQLTQKELAALINAKHNSISNWENNQNMPDPDTIQHLCWALNVQPNYFFSVHSAPEQRNENKIKIAARDGSYEERVLTDEQLVALKAFLQLLPDADGNL